MPADAFAGLDNLFIGLRITDIIYLVILVYKFFTSTFSIHKVK